MEAYDVIIKPLITEKSSKGMMDDSFFTFEVNPRATKTDVKKAIEYIFRESGVVVKKVNIANYSPKKKRAGRFEGTKKGYKKAYVFLSAGTIPVFGSEEAAEREESKKDKKGISSVVADSILNVDKADNKEKEDK